METKPAKESIVSRLFGFGRKRPKAAATPDGDPAETGFARTDAEEGPEEDPSITVPEQVIRIRPGGVRRKDEAIQAIGDSFRELTSMLGSINDRLDRQDNHSADLTDQLRELPEYLQKLPRLQEAQNDAMRRSNDIAESAAQSLAKIPQVQAEQSRALGQLTERLTEGTRAVRDMADAVSRIPDELRDRSASQEAAIRKVAAAQEQTAKVIHVGHQKSLQLFHQATQKTLLNVQNTTKRQQGQMQELLDESFANMRRMFYLAAAFMGAAIIAVVALLWLR